MVHYRSFRNTDPPRLVDLWNEAFPNRGAVPLVNSTPLEQFVFAKPIFDPAGLLIAEEDGNLAGFAHAGLSTGPDGNDAIGVVFVMGVRTAYRRRGIGTELLRRCEEYLKSKGARTLQAGACWPHNLFYLGLYGGCDSPGFLKSDPLAEPFFLKHGYAVTRRFIVFQKDLEQTIKIADSRFMQHRNKLEILGAMPRRLPGYWQECILGFIEPVELRVEDQRTHKTLAKTLVWEMDGFARRWGGPAMGVLRFEVDPSVRRTGVGKFLLAHLLRQVREQFFKVAEIHLESTNQKAIQFLQSLAFQEEDVGQVFTRTDL